MFYLLSNYKIIFLNRKSNQLFTYISITFTSCHCESTLPSKPTFLFQLTAMVNSNSDPSNPLSHLVENISSYDTNVMLAAVVSLLLVILFVLLLHIYAKWFLAQARQRRRNSISVSQVLRPAHRFHQFHSFTFDTTTTLSSSPSKGLEPSIIASIPLFVYSSNESKQGLECVICSKS